MESKIMLAIGAYFILCQIIIKKQWYPKFLQREKASATTLQAMAIIAVSILLGILVKPLGYLAIMVTIFMGSIIADKYIQIFEKLERGERV